MYQNWINTVWTNSIKKSSHGSQYNLSIFYAIIYSPEVTYRVNCIVLKSQRYVEHKHKIWKLEKEIWKKNVSFFNALHYSMPIYQQDRINKDVQNCILENSAHCTRTHWGGAGAHEPSLLQSKISSPTRWNLVK